VGVGVDVDDGRLDARVVVEDGRLDVDVVVEDGRPDVDVDADVDVDVEDGRPDVDVVVDDGRVLVDEVVGVWAGVDVSVARGIGSNVNGEDGSTGNGCPDGGNAASGLRSTTLTVNALYCSTSCCWDGTSLTLCTVVDSVTSRSCASSHLPCCTNCCTCANSVCAANTTASSRVFADSPKSMARRP
jgi:hypothetical protein